MSGNDYIRAGSTFHTLHSIAQQAAPVASGGIESLVTDTFRLRCLETQTGFKFFVLANPSASSSDLDEVLSGIYCLFSDYVQKNPFYKEGMLIKCALFESRVLQLSDQFSGYFRSQYGK